MLTVATIQTFKRTLRETEYCGVLIECVCNFFSFEFCSCFNCWDQLLVIQFIATHVGADQ